MAVCSDDGESADLMSYERDREEFLIDSLKQCNLCCKALERRDGDEEEGQMWEEEPLNQCTLLGDDSSSLTLLFHVCFPLSQGITLPYSLSFYSLKTLQDSM